MPTHTEDTEVDWYVGFSAEIERIHANPPTAPEGLKLIECTAEPRHWPMYAAHVEGMYEAPCPSCLYANDRERIDRLEHEAHHHRWQTWRITNWLSGKLYVLGLISGSSHSWPPCCRRRTSLSWRGKRSYILGKPRPWWECLRHGHRYSPLQGHTFDLCTTCLPCPDCGSTGQDHYAC